MKPKKTKKENFCFAPMKVEKPRKLELSDEYAKSEYAGEWQDVISWYNQALEESEAYHKQDIKENYVRKDSVLGREGMISNLTTMMKDCASDGNIALVNDLLTWEKLGIWFADALLSKGNIAKGMSVGRIEEIITSNKLTTQQKIEAIYKEQKEQKGE